MGEGIMGIRTATVFITDDGNQHNTLQEAQEWAERGKFKDWVINNNPKHNQYDEFGLRSLLDLILDHWNVTPKEREE